MIFSNIFDIIVFIFSTIYMIYGLYYLIISLFIFKKSKETNIITKKINKFSILIAARNEESVIGNLIDSLKNQNYDKNKYEINVIVNNTTDNTYKVAQNHGATVFDLKKRVKSKGEVLKYIFKKFKNKRVDAYIIFDADNIVDPDFLKNMNDSLNKGYKVAQGVRKTKNYRDNWISGSYAIFYYLRDFFYNTSRYNIKSSPVITGTGFMVEKNFIDEINFNPKTLTEDTELSTLCAIRNEKIDFVKGAITYDEQPTTMKASKKQRLRWARGNIQCWKLYHNNIFKSFKKNHNLACIDLYLGNIIAVFQFISILLLFIKLIQDLLLKRYIYINNFIISIIISYLITFFISTFVIKCNHKKIKDFLPSLIMFSFFLLTWFPINIISLFKKDIKWDPIKHDRSIKIEDIFNK